MEDAQELTRAPSVGSSVDARPITDIAGGTEFIITFGHRLSEVTYIICYDCGSITVQPELEFEFAMAVIKKTKTTY